MNELALFAGAGGGILGGKLLGWRTVCAVEWEAYAASVLCARQNDGALPAFPIWDDVRTFDGRPWRGIVDVVSGGFPCQDISAAGKGAGIEGERSGMWTEMARIIGEVRPRFAFVENSPMLTSRGLGRVLGDLAALGYDARWGVLGAVDAGAPHKRDRIWIVAHAEHGRYTNSVGEVNGKEIGLSGEDRTEGRRTGLPIRTNGVVRHRSTDRIQDQINAAVSNADNRGDRRREQQPQSSEGAGHVADSNGAGLEGRKHRAGADAQGWQEPHGSTGKRGGMADANSARRQQQKDEAYTSTSSRQSRDAVGGHGWWTTEPDLGRVAHGVAARVDRLKAIGNGQVPAVAALAWEMLTA